MKRPRDFAKRILEASPTIYQQLQGLYHELRFQSASARLRGLYPQLNIVRHSEREIERQRRLGFQS